MKYRMVASGAAVRIDDADLLQSGGEGSVYRLPARSDRVAKIYHHPSLERRRKLEVMIRHPPSDPMTAKRHVSIAWPQELLGDHTGAFQGFLMARIDGADTIANIHHPQTRRRRHPSFDYRYLHRTAANLAIAVDALHRRGYVVGDINDQNVLVNSQALVTLIDTDSLQVRDPDGGPTYRCGVGRPEFTPPEVAGRDLSQLDRSVEHDLFGLAVLFFYLLMEGTHPFSGVPQDGTNAPSLAERIAAGLFPFTPGEARIAVPPGAPPLEMLAPELRTLFVTCFKSGQQHPALRPSAAAWNKALDAACHQLVQCPSNDLHWFGNHLPSCPWCARAAALGYDAFPKTAPRPIRHAPPVSAPRPGGVRPSLALAAGVKSPILRRGAVIVLAAVAAIFFLAKACSSDDHTQPRSSVVEPARQACLSGVARISGRTHLARHTAPPRRRS